jgi:hypothetical protein
MMQFIWFLGRFHVLLVHLPLGILTLAVALEILVRFRPFRSPESAVAPAWIAGAITSCMPPKRASRTYGRSKPTNGRE